MTLEESLAGKEIPEEIRKSLAIVTVPYLSFLGEACEGQLVVHNDLAEEVKEIFDTLFEMRFPIERMTPIIAYDWDDDVSMAANNCSAFNYRLISGTDRLSNHSFGRAIDVNPALNPYVRPDGTVLPPQAQYDVTRPGTVTVKEAAVFASFGWQWGGNWSDRKDWQHFEKPN